MSEPTVNTRPDTTLPIATGAQVRTVMVTLLKLHRGRSLAVAVLFLVASGLGLVVPACLGRIVDAVSSDAGFATIAGWVVGAGVGAIGASAVTLWGMRTLASLVQDTLASLREDVFASAMRLPVSTIDDGESADLLSRVTGDVDAVAKAGANVAPTLLSAGFAVAVSLVALTALDPWLALAGIACVPFYVLGTRAFLRRSRVVFREVRVREAARSQAVIDAVEGLETLTALNEQDHALGRVQARAERSIEIQIEGVRVRNRLFRWINGGEAVGLGALLAVGFELHANGAISIAMVTTAALVFHRLFGPIGQLIFGLDDIQRAAIGLARLVGIIDLVPAASPPEPVEGPTRDSFPELVEGGPSRQARRTKSPALAVSFPEPVEGPTSQRTGVGISLQDATFHYPTTGRGIDGVTLRVEPGATAAFVGTSGSGKSTVARVIAGHHSPESGSVTLDDPAATPYYISQELHHFRGSIADNMRLVAPDASDEQIDAALRAVGADWAVHTARPAGADQAVRGESAGRDHPAGGDPAASDAPLDEGRIQQLALARALLADPAVVILDEATADVGLHHRDAVEAAIARLCHGRTAVVIAHRLQQAQLADQVTVFADGRITQRGKHDELVATDGPYRTFWLAQTSSQNQTTTTRTETP